MNIVATVFTLISASVAGLIAYIFGTQNIRRGPQGWTPVVGFILGLVVLFSGSVVATGRTGWSYGVGGGLVCFLFVLLWNYHKSESDRRNRYDTSLAALCPDATQDATTTFHQALSVCVG
jgi:ammonia channel protein AmtB